MASEEDIAQFTGITGGSVEQANFFIGSAGGNVEMAVSAFFDTGGAIEGTGGPGPADEEDEIMEDEEEVEEEERRAEAQQTRVAPVPVTVAPASSGSWGAGRTLDGAEAPGGSAPSSTSSSRAATPSNPFRSNAGSRVSTLRDLNAAAAPAPSRGSGGPRVGRVPHGNDDDDDDDQDPAEFFTGGEKSGLSVENPNKKGGGAGDMIKGILQKAKEGGSRLAGAAAGAAPGQARSLFSGAAHTLGSDETPSTFIPDPTARPATRVPGGFPGAPEVTEEEVEEETVVKTLTFWKNGFSIEDGDLMTYEENKEILAAINSGRAPLSLLKVRHDQPVELRISKRLDEDWARQPKGPSGPFGGSGHRLGSEASPPPEAAPPAVASPAANRPALGTVFEVDGNQPVTSLQIRLRDGTRMVARFNYSHTVGDVRRYINASHPGQAATNYALQTTFPSHDLTDDSQTLKDANLLGSVVVQRGL